MLTGRDGMKRIVESAVSSEIVIEGQRYLNFGGSAYLGLARNTEILEAGIATLRTTGAGYQIARHCQVETRAHQQVESEAAKFFHSEAAMYFAGGYLFGLIALAAVKDRFSVIFFDEVAHYSLREAIGASGLPSHPFKHLDPEDLRKLLKMRLNAKERPLIVTDGLFPTIGEIAPLSDLSQVMSEYDGRLLVDESHSFGVLGAQGRGAAEHHNIPSSSTWIGGSLSKAFGGCGGIIPASEADVAAFRATPVGLGGGAGMPAAATMCAASLRFVRKHPELLERLRENVAYMKGGLRKIGLKVAEGVAPIASFGVGDRQAMQSLQSRLMSEGIFVLYTNYIGAGMDGVIRCGIFADHTKEQIDRLLETLRRIL